MTETDKKEKAAKILEHAQAHCRFGSNADNTDRIPTQDDIEAAYLLRQLWRDLKGIPRQGLS